MGGIIVGIVLGVLFMICFAVGIYLRCKPHKKNDKTSNENHEDEKLSTNEQI